MCVLVNATLPRHVEYVCLESLSLSSFLHHHIRPTAFPACFQGALICVFLFYTSLEQPAAAAAVAAARIDLEVGNQPTNHLYPVSVQEEDKKRATNITV